jgi:hypothetical protein
MRFQAIFLLGVILMAGGPPASAHHAISSEFDLGRQVTLAGVVTQVDWVNPHAWFYVEVKDAKSGTKNWAVQLGSPNLLGRLGWTRQTVKTGDKVSIDGAAAKDGSAKANARTVRLADGRTVFVGNPASVRQD